MLVPIIMRMLGRFEGIPEKKEVELSLMDRYFMFQVIVCGSFVSSLTKSLTKDSTERLFGCHVLVRHHCFVALPGEPPIISPESAGSESTEIFDFFPDVGVVLELS
jgi:Calcium-dependent channel, 7TM region, putative phosphate